MFSHLQNLAFKYMCIYAHTCTHTQMSWGQKQACGRGREGLNGEGKRSREANRTYVSLNHLGKEGWLKAVREQTRAKHDCICVTTPQWQPLLCMITEI